MIESKIPKKLGLKWKNKQVVMIPYTVNNTNLIEIRQKVDELRNDLKTKMDGQMMVSINFGGQIGWRSGYFTDLNDPISFWDPTDSDVDYDIDTNPILGVDVFVVKNAPKHGGHGENNDCLFDCLDEIINAGWEYEPNDLPWNKGAELKDFLCIPRNAPIKMSDIYKVDERLPKHKINVRGDYVYTSTKTTKRTCNLVLLDGHFSIKRESRVKVPYVSHLDQKIIIYEKHPVLYYTYDGKEMKYLNFAEFQELRNNQKFGSKLVEKYPKMSLQQSYVKFIESANQLKDESNGLINPYKTGKHVWTALELFDSLTLDITPEKIEQDEALWLEYVKQGAIIEAIPYKGEIYKYDFCSLYPSILHDPSFKIAVERGDFKKLTEEHFKAMDDRICYGIYRCKISYKVNTFFKWNKNHYYTHIDIRNAKDQGLDVQLIVDDSPNALIYTDKCVQSQVLYKKYVKILFDLKQKKIDGAKEILNVIWGALCQVNKMNMIIGEDEEVEIRENREIISIQRVAGGKLRVEYYKNEQIFSTDYARMGPFLLARGRERVARIAFKNRDSIKRIHTDSFFSTKKLPNKTGNNLGQLKYEGYCQNCEIVNKCKVIGEFV